MKDPISALTHLVGAILAVIGVIILVYYSSTKASIWHVVSFSIFGAALILLYSASTIYHLLKVSKKVNDILRKIDHMMIYVLIAGTYTPVCLIPLRGAWGWSLLVAIWGIAIGGIVLKLVWLEAPRWLSTGLYVVMGWLVVIAIYPLSKTLPSEAMAWMTAGGITYTLGAVIYGLKWPPITYKWFGFHEIFHLFVMGGSLCHFWMMFRFILYV